MTRIVGGFARGRSLTVPGTGVRPTSDRAREAIFSSLESLRGSFQGASVLDLYAGSGALGLEALSRGAAHIDLVESDPAAARVIEANHRALRGRSGGTTTPAGSVAVHAVPVERWSVGRRPVPIQRGSTASSGVGTYDVVFCDPPYALSPEAVSAVLEALLVGRFLAPEALVVVERSRRDPEWVWPAGFVALRDRAYGEARLWVGGLGGGQAPSDSVAPC